MKALEKIDVRFHNSSSSTLFSLRFSVFPGAYTATVTVYVTRQDEWWLAVQPGSYVGVYTDKANSSFPISWRPEWDAISTKAHIVPITVAYPRIVSLFSDAARLPLPAFSQSGDAPIW